MPIAGVTILVDPVGWVAVPMLASGTTGVPGVGALQVPLPIPVNQLLVGAELDFQVLAVDPAGAAGLSASDGLTLTICNS